MMLKKHVVQILVLSGWISQVVLFPFSLYAQNPEPLPSANPQASSVGSRPADQPPGKSEAGQKARVSLPVPPFPSPVPPDFYDEKRKSLVQQDVCAQKDIKVSTISRESTHVSGCRILCDYRIKTCGDDIVEETVLGKKITGGNYKIPEAPSCEANCLTGQPLPNCNDPAESNLVQSQRPTADKLSCPSLKGA